MVNVTQQTKKYKYILFLVYEKYSGYNKKYTRQ